MTDDKLSEHQQLVLRVAVCSTAYHCLGIPYYLGAEWTDYSKRAESLDCSELIEGSFVSNGLKMPDGSQNQFNFTVPIPKEKVKLGDLAFFGKGGDSNKIYHVGIVYDDLNIIEARGYQEGSSFETGKVILRNKKYWEEYQNFVGYRGHPKLI